MTIFVVMAAMLGVLIGVALWVDWQRGHRR